MIAKLKAFWAKLKGWKTVLANTLLGIPPIILLVLDYLETVDLSAIVTAREAVIYTVAIKVINIVLRTKTTTPVGKSEG